VGLSGITSIMFLPEKAIERGVRANNKVGRLLRVDTELVSSSHEGRIVELTGEMLYEHSLNV